MTRLTPRKSEYGPIQEILETGEFENFEKMAKAIVEQAYSTFLERDWYLAVAKMAEGYQFTFGLFDTEHAATKAITSGALGLLGGTQAGVIHMSSAEKRLEYVRGN